MSSFQHSMFTAEPDARELPPRCRAAFAWELLVIGLLFLLVPALTGARATSPLNGVRQVESLMAVMPCLVIIVGLSVSVIRNPTRPMSARLAAGAALFCCIVLSVEPLHLLLSSL